MQQPCGSPIPPSLIPTPVGTRLSRSSTTSSGRYYSRSSLCSSSSYHFGRARSISATYTRANNTATSRAHFAKHAPTSSHHSLLRKVVGRSTTATTDDAGYESDLEDQYAFDAVNTLKTRFNRSPKTAATLRALRIMEQRMGTSSVAFADVTDDAMGRTDANRKARKELVEDWSDDYDIPETAKCIVHSESPKHIPAFLLNQTLVCTNIDTTAEEAMHDNMKYEPLIAPVDALSDVTDTFFRQGGFTRGSSVEDLSVNHIPDNSLDIEEMMARHADFANVTQLLNKTENLDFSTTSFQVWRDVPSSLSVDSFSNSLTTTPVVNHDNSPFARAPLQPKTHVHRTPSKLRDVIEITPPEEAIEAGVPTIVLQDATEGSVSPDVFPSRVFGTYPSGVSTLPIWVDSVSFFTALEGSSDGDLLSLGAQHVGQTQNQLDDEDPAARSLVIDNPPTATTVQLVPTSDSTLKSCTASSELNESTPIAPSDRFFGLTTMSISNSGIISHCSGSLLHYQLETTVVAPPGFHDESLTTSCGWGGASIPSTQCICAVTFPARLPGLQQGVTDENLDKRAITQTKGAPSRLVVDDQHDLAASFAHITPVVKGPRLELSTPPSTLPECDFPTIESLVSLPDFYDFSNSVPVDALEQPSAVRSHFININDAESLRSLDFEDVLLRSLPAPVTKLSTGEARDWGRVVEVCVITPSSTMHVDPRHDAASIVTASHAPSYMDETPLVNGEIFTVDDPAGLRYICEQEEEDIILLAPLSGNNVSNFMSLSSMDLPLEPDDLVCEVADIDGTPLNNQNTLPSPASVGLEITGMDNATLDFSVSSAECSVPSQSSPFAISAPQLDNPLNIQELPQEIVSEFPNAAIAGDIATDEMNVVPEAVWQLEPTREERLRSPITRAHGPTRRRISAIVRWRQACAKAEILSLSDTSATHRDHSLIENLSDSSVIHYNLCRSVSSPPCTQQYSSLVAVRQAVHVSVSRARSLVLGISTYRDLYTRNMNGCAHKRRSKRTRSAPKSSFLSKASSIPTALRSNISGTASKKAGSKLVTSSTSAPLASNSFFVEGFANSTVIPDSAQQCRLEDERQNFPGASIPPIETAAKNPNPDASILGGWENADMSFWGSACSGKRKRLRNLFKRPGPLEGYVAASTTSSGLGHPTDSYNPSMSRSQSRRLLFDPNTHTPVLFAPGDATPNAPTLPFPFAATLAPSKSPKRKRLGFNWISRSRASALVSSSLKPAIDRPSDPMPTPQTKPKGGRLGAVAYRLQSFF